MGGQSTWHICFSAQSQRRTAQLQKLPSLPPPRPRRRSCAGCRCRGSPASRGSTAAWWTAARRCCARRAWPASGAAACRPLPRSCPPLPPPGAPRCCRVASAGEELHACMPLGHPKRRPLQVLAAGTCCIHSCVLFLLLLLLWPPAGCCTSGLWSCGALAACGGTAPKPERARCSAAVFVLRRAGAPTPPRQHALYLPSPNPLSLFAASLPFRS